MVDIESSADALSNDWGSSRGNASWGVAGALVGAVVELSSYGGSGSASGVTEWSATLVLV